MKTQEVQTERPNATIHDIREKVKPKFGHTFFDQAESYIKPIKDGRKLNQYIAQEPLINKFRKFIGSDIEFAGIFVGFMELNEAWLKSQRTKKRHSFSKRSIMNHRVVIPSAYGHARKKKVIPADQYHFGFEMLHKSYHLFMATRKSCNKSLRHILYFIHHLLLFLLIRFRIIIPTFGKIRLLIPPHHD